MLLSVANAHAYERIENVYEALVPLQDRSEAARNEAMKQGLEQVLVRYTGYASVGGFVEVSRELDSAQKYVIEYGVETIDMAAEDGLGKEQTDGLWVRYNAALIDQLAQDIELPIWPTYRPTLSYVLVNQLWGAPHLPTLQEFPALWVQLDSLFKIRGLAAQRMSAGQIAGLSATQLWNLDEQLASSLRQQAVTDIVAVIRIDGNLEQGYKLDFLFMDAESERLLHRSDQTLVAALEAGINSYVDDLSADMAFLGGTEIESDLYIQIEGIRSYKEYKKILNQIAGLEQVISVRMDSTTDTGIGYFIRFQSNRQMLIDSISVVTGIVQIPAAVQLPRIAQTPRNAQLPGATQATGTVDALGRSGREYQPGTASNPIYFQYPNSAFKPAASAPLQGQSNRLPVSAGGNRPDAGVGVPANGVDS